MLKDPTDLRRRKPQRLRGTPANRFVNLVAVGIVSVFTSLCLWYTYSEAEWVKRGKARLHEKTKLTEDEIVRRKMFMDPMLGNIIVQTKERIAAKKAGENLDDRPIREFVEERTSRTKIYGMPED